MENSKKIIKKQEDFLVRRIPGEEKLLLHNGKPVRIPENWIFVPSGDPGLTRRLKTGGEYWVLVHYRKNRLESLGLYTDGKRVAGCRRALEIERSSDEYQRKMDSARRSRAREQQRYEQEFFQAVLQFLDFAPEFREYAEELAHLVTEHAIPVGSGTVARTERIPIERRAEAAVIAWMRHQSTAYDQMSVPRVKGARRELRRKLAARSREILARYRTPAASSANNDREESCPLMSAILRVREEKEMRRNSKRDDGNKTLPNAELSDGINLLHTHLPNETIRPQSSAPTTQQTESGIGAEAFFDLPSLDETAMKSRTRPPRAATLQSGEEEQLVETNLLGF